MGAPCPKFIHAGGDRMPEGVLADEAQQSVMNLCALIMDAAASQV